MNERASEMTETHNQSAVGRWFVPGDLDGYFALFFSGFPDLLLIVGLGSLCGFSSQFVTQRILPAVALSIFVGNIFFAWQARQLAKRTGRDDVTAIPFGVNTPTIFAYIFLVMVPVFNRTKDPELTWQVGMLCCFLSGIVQTLGAFCTDWLRRRTPRAALLCPLAGIAIAFLCLGFVFQIFQYPTLALLPAIIILTFYSGRLRLPGRLPAGLLCIVVGLVAALVLKGLHLYNLPDPPPVANPGFYLPHPVNALQFLAQGEGWKYLPIVFSMSLLDTIVSLQVLETSRLLRVKRRHHDVNLSNWGGPSGSALCAVGGGGDHRHLVWLIDDGASLHGGAQVACDCGYLWFDPNVGFLGPRIGRSRS